MKRKSLNPVILLLNKNFSQVNESTQIIIVEKTCSKILMFEVSSIMMACTRMVEAAEEIEITVYVKHPFTKTFVSGTKLISNAMAHYFPEEEVVETTEEVDEVETEEVVSLEGMVVIPIITEEVVVVETTPKRKKRKVAE